MSSKQPTYSVGETTVDRRSLIKAYVASLTGTSLEWYDFAVYSAAAALVLPQLFFPSEDPLTGALLAFSTYAVGYLSRPLGGVVFGRLGDKIGRKQVLVITLLLMGVSTFVIGLLPTYATAGVLGPILLVLLRFAQGVGIGGEWGGAVLLSSEFGSPRKRGFWASAAQVGPPAGNLLANGMLALLTATMSEETFLDWGWRVAFLVSAVLVAFGLWIRLKLEDTPVFRAIEAKGDRAEVVTATLVGSFFQVGLIPLAGAVSDRVNRRLLYGIAAVAAGLYPFAFFAVMDGKNWWLWTAGIVVGLAIHSFLYGPQAALITEQFSPRLRYTGSSLAYTIAGVFGGAIAPLAFTFLLSQTKSWVAVAGYLAVAAVLTVIGALIARNPNHAEDEEYLAAAPEPASSS